MTGPPLPTIEPPEGVAAERPYTVANMASTVDGRATVEGVSGSIGNAADHARFLHLRSQADAILVGPGTLRAERYGPMQPLCCIVSRSLRVPLDIPLFADPGSRVVVFTSSPGEFGEDVPARVECVRVEPRELSFASVLRRLRADFGVRTLLCEGGPTVLGALIAEGLLDELFLTFAPLLAGGAPASASIAHTAPLTPPRRLRLRSVDESESYLFLRYARAY